jgi:hypothetical protein
VAETGGPAQSPWVYQAPDYRGNLIRITITFNNATRAITSATVFRDAACVYTKIYIGLGADGTPNSTNKVFSIPPGTTSVPLSQLSNNGLNTIEDVLALQVTAGP